MSAVHWIASWIACHIRYVVFTGIANTTSTPIGWEVGVAASKGYIFTKSSQITFTGVIFTSTCHTKQLNPWIKSSASCVVIHSELSTCQGKMGPFEGHLSTCGHQTGLRKRPEWKHTVQPSAILNRCSVGPLMYLTNGYKKYILKLRMYETPFGKSGHICRLQANSHKFSYCLLHYWRFILHYIYIVAS